ncbi:MAG: family 20 glycosylhydrolase [Bacteroidales bacterium]|nr:family 20 glycosylhydrolase [Bacteroidales bacterium]
MTKINYFLFILLLLVISSCNFENTTHLDSPIIPRPDGIFPVPSTFTVSDKTSILLESDDEQLLHLAEKLKSLLDTIMDIDVRIQDINEAKGLKNVILLSTTNTTKRIDKDGYSLKVDKDKVIIQGNGFGGVFNGVMTLSQMVLLTSINKEYEIDKIANVQIRDDPQFSYRGMHLDVGRHFFPTTFIKKYLDIMALYKFNYFHWHLTEDQGWRIEIKAFPKLSEEAAWRIEKDGTKYGGFYSQDEIRDVVAYAKNLNITIIPEIEMPGHSRAALMAYPELSCTGKLQEVPNRWGVFEDVYCAGNEQTFNFIETVLDEVMDLFPGEYIHIGGDESPKAKWEECSKCQTRIKEEDLANEHELQSYFIQRIEKYLNANGRKLIGWDEILEGGLAPDATVMSWRGIQGGIDAAREEHEVIMTPTDYCYFDHYQGDPDFEPHAIGGYLPLTKVYAFNPIPQELNEEQAQFILGGQANMWTEYMEDTDHVEYMLLPRMLALSEALWSSERYHNFKDFNKRLQTHKKLLEVLGYQYSNGSFKVQMETQYDTTESANMVRFSSEQYEPIIRYTLDHTLPNDSSLLYDKPFSPDSSCRIQAAIFKNGELQRKASSFDYQKHLGIGKIIKLKKKPSWRYGAETNAGLLDGIRGTENYGDGRWTGFQAKDFIAEIDLMEEQAVHSISFAYIMNSRAWILPPKSVTIYTSKDGKSYTEYFQLSVDEDPLSEEYERKKISISLNGDSLRYFKMTIESYKKLPLSHPSAGNDCWLFIDEIVIE